MTLSYKFHNRIQSVTNSLEIYSKDCHCSVLSKTLPNGRIRNARTEGNLRAGRIEIMALLLKSVHRHCEISRSVNRCYTCNVLHISYVYLKNVKTRLRIRSNHNSK
jgi:hypothetical protein